MTWHLEAIDRRAWVVVLAAMLSVSLSCASDDAGGVEPASGDRANASGVISPMCQLGCLDQDPEPDSDGYFLGSAITWNACTNGSQTDTDQDGLSDYCERNIARTFAPELYYSSADEVGREPKWVAKLEQGQVRIAYLLSYYRDAGSSAYVCSLPPPFGEESCYGHNGDAELIALDVVYNSTSQHWILETAWLSQHGAIREYASSGCTYPPDPGWRCVLLTYPDVYRGYPRVWVSMGKHANYGDGADCEDGGAADVDTCVENDSFERIWTPASANLGSRAHHASAQDCMPSGDPSYQYYGSGRAECYWSYRNFRGWIPESVGGMESTPPYTHDLAELGF